MFKNLYKILLLSLLCFVSCNEIKFKSITSDKTLKIKNKKLQSIEDFKNWHFKDIEIDTLLGISLNRAYDSLLINKKGKDVVVAVIDMPIEINHQGLSNYIWKNKNEIIGNNIDDDKNGYIDDINGWNFLSNKSGDTNEFVNYEYTRILKKFQDKKNQYKDSIYFKIYRKAKQKHQERLVYAKEEVEYIYNIFKWKNEAEEIISVYLKKSKHNLKSLDSLKKIHLKDKKLEEAILKKSNFIKYGFSDKYIDDYKLKAEERINKLLNLNYNDRQIQGDNPELITDINYGSPNFKVNTVLLDHGTKMTGVVVNIAIRDEIKIMPIAISAYGDEHDKDIALAIRYAVDNGAKVINMSFAKEFSLKPKLVLDAIKYAEKNNVLLISGAANENQNIENKDIHWFPNDHSYFNNVEIANNFMKVGSSGVYLNNKLKSSFSNYSKEEVDLFAPGEYIYSTFPKNKFDIIYGGTSSATAITSGVAALLYSYYPNLTASQVKQILMDSGLEYKIEVSTPTKEDKKKMTPFNELSKSGKVLNAYNAFIMADSISRN